MSKNTTLLVIKFAFLMCVLSVANAAVTATSNYCTPGACAQCSKVSAGTKFCEFCVYSSKKLVEAATPGVFECVNKRSVSNCFSYYEDSNLTKAGCIQCNTGYVATASGLVGTKTNYKCVEIPTAGMTKIANCSKTVLSIGYLSLSGSGDGSGPSGSASTTCEKCDSGYVFGGSGSISGSDSANQCVLIPTSAVKVENCEVMSLDGSKLECQSCNSGYYDVKGVCVAWTNNPGCAGLNEDGKCGMCNIFRSYYAVDLDDSKGQVCQYKSFLAGIGSFILLVLTGLFLGN
jgi:hypothetical protein